MDQCENLRYILHEIMYRVPPVSTEAPMRVEELKSRENCNHGYFSQHTINSDRMEAKTAEDRHLPNAESSFRPKSVR